VGAYDKGVRAGYAAWVHMREGMSKDNAIATAAREHKLERESVRDALERARKRGPIEPYDVPEDDPN
jgi:hypothetical protein